MNILLLLVLISIYLGTLAPFATDIEIKDVLSHGIHHINVWLDILLSQERVELLQQCDSDHVYACTQDVLEKYIDVW